MDLSEAAEHLADEGAEFALLHDSAHRNLIIARAGPIHAIVAEAVDRDTGLWLVECLKHGAPHAPTTLPKEGTFRENSLS